MTTLTCETNGTTTATVEKATAAFWNVEYRVKLYDQGWQVANMGYGTMAEAAEVTYTWAAEH